MKPFFVFGIAIIALGVGNLSGEIKVIDLKDTAPPKDPLKSAIKWSKIQNRNGIAYLPNTDTPFNGYGKRTYDNDQVEVLAEFKNGFVANLKQWRKNGIPKCDFSFSLGKVRLIDVPFEFYWDTNDSYKNGAQTIWYENGQKEYEFNYKDGIRNGEGLCWHENGQLHIKENILDGKLDGKLVNWYECGQISVEEHYAKGVKHGDFTSWYENGQIGRKCRFMNGKLVGPYVRWYENGQKLSDGNFTDGELHGLQSIFFKSENKSAEYYYKKGNCITAKVWLPNGEICPETTLENGNGHRVLWHENGQKAEMFLFKDGKLDGIAREWHENGMMSYERNFKEGKLHGLVTSWSEAGEQNYQINYVNGKEVDLPEDSPEVTIGNKVFSLDELDRIPLAIKNGDLVYPESLLGKGLSGEVKLLIQINERGRVMVMEILSATHPLFGKAASIAAENSLYEIPTRDGKPVSAQFHLPVKFTASQPSWSASEQISHNYKHGKVRLELSYMHQLDGLKKDQEEKFSTETILLVDGNFVYALIHAMDGPLRVSFNPHTLISMQGRITSQKLSKPITINEVAFMDDPRIIIVPLYANPEELRKTGLELFEAPANPFLFDDAVCMDVGKGKLGRIKCMRDQIDGRYIEVDERSFAFETGAINPGKGNLLFTRKSELLGIMINGDYAFHVKNLGSRIHGGSRTLLGSAFDSDKTNKLLRDLSGQFSTIDKRFKY